MKCTQHEAAAMRSVKPQGSEAQRSRMCHGPEPVLLALHAGDVLHEAGSFSPDIWTVVEGALRQDLVEHGSQRFVQLALAGDHLSTELLCGLPTLYRTSAVTRCTLQRLPIEGDAGRCAAISAALTQACCRAADLIALRTGPATERVRQLLLLLSCKGRAGADGPAHIELPRLRNIAAIVDAAPETVSRILSTWRRDSMLRDTDASTVQFDRARLASCEILEGTTRSSHRSRRAQP